MTQLSSERRGETYEHIKHEQLDIFVIGGGITGCGIALDAAARGMKVGLVDMQDFAAGTSSRSTKLIHGGLRYLQQLEFKIVAEVGKEREIVYENGPHVTTPEWMMLPFYKGGSFGPLMTNVGLRVYDFLAGVKKNERRKMFDAQEALAREPLLNPKDLKGAGYYVEYKTDDARLTIEVLKKAVEYGAIALNYTKVIEFIYEPSGKLIGVIVQDQVNGEKHHIYAKKIVNATGPWVDEVRDLDGSKQGKTLHITKGVHIVFSKKDFPLQQAIYFDGKDGRMIFAIPRDDKTYVGTTDTTYDGDLIHPTMTKADEDYLLAATNGMFPTLQVTAEHVESSWAGLRPLISEAGKKPGEISRKDEIFISKTGLFSMAGGKLTGYRKMAEDLVNQIVKQLKEEEEGVLYSDSDTRHIPISGGDVGGSTGFHSFKLAKMAEGLEMGLPQNAVSTLLHQYGSNIDIIFRLIIDKQEEALENGIEPIVFAELVYAIHYELAHTPADFFVRRTGALFFDINWVKEHRASVTTYMAKTLQWNEEQTKNYEQELTKMIHEAHTPQE